MPGDVPIRNGLFHALALPRGGLFEVLVNQPRTGSPNVSVAARLPHRRRGFDGSREILVEILAHHIGLGIDESQVQMTLEHDQDALDVRIRNGWFGVLKGTRGLRKQRPEGGRGKKIGKESSASHGGLEAMGE